MAKFFLAILPPQKVSDEIISFQKELAAEYGFYHALKTAPHLTVIPPFECEEEKLLELSSLVKKQNFHSLSIKLNGFQAFVPRVLFVDVQRNEGLHFLQRKIRQMLIEEKMISKRMSKHEYVPHITLANRDLTNKTFKQIFPHFQNRNFQAVFQQNSITLLKHNGMSWETKEDLFFS